MVFKKTEIITKEHVLTLDVDKIMVNVAEHIKDYVEDCVYEEIINMITDEEYDKYSDSDFLWGIVDSIADMTIQKMCKKI